MEKFGKRTEAIGFAVYLDRLERYAMDTDNYDVDVLVLYDENAEAQKIVALVEKFKAEGKTVRAANLIDKSVSYKELVRVGQEGADILEKND